MHPKNLSIADFTYSLPEERIASYPLAERDASKLLVYQDDNITEDVYRNISRHIPANSLLIFNDTKVVEARLLFQKSTGGVIEIFCLEPDKQYPDITTAMLQQVKVLWHCLIGGASKWKHGQILSKKILFNKKELELSAKYIDRSGDSFIIELSWNEPTLSFAEVLHIFGAIPLPPYLKRKVELSDAERYQTVYAHFDGSVAAPTAGLHFTPKIFAALKEKKIATDFLTLHVGAGTFKPVKSETMDEHEMHAEQFTVTRSFIQNLVNHLDKNIIAVGTTSLRTIESLYWLGLKLKMENGKWNSELTQWEVYENYKKDISTIEALNCLLEKMENENIDSLHAKTQIIIAPGYQFRIANGLITNFHQPQSTLLLLVAAFIGKNWKNVYQYALENNFRFLSYGDGNLYWRHGN